MTCPFHATLKRPDRCRTCAQEAEGRAAEPGPVASERVLRIEDVDRGALEKRTDHRGRTFFRFKGAPIAADRKDGWG